MNKFFEFLRTPLAGAVIFLLQRLLGSMAEAGQRAGRRPENSREGEVTGIAVGGSEAPGMIAAWIPAPSIPRAACGNATWRTRWENG